MKDAATLNVGRNDFRRYVLAIKDSKVINRSLASDKYRVKSHISRFEDKYKDVEGVSIGVCFIDEFDCDKNCLKAGK